MVQQAVLEKKAADLGLDVLSDEEKAEVEESADSTYTLYSTASRAAYLPIRSWKARSWMRPWRPRWRSLPTPPGRNW